MHSSSGAGPSRKPPARYRIAFAVLCLFAVAVLAIGVWNLSVSRSGIAKQNTALGVAERADCAREIAAGQTKERDRLQLAKARHDQLVIGAALLPAEARPTRAELVRVANMELDEAIRRVDRLRPLDVLVDERCPSVT
jgi:hypothetical protein